MPPAATIMDAYYLRRGEDRVTEVFATVLAAVRPLVVELAGRAGLPEPDRYEVETQVRSGRCTIDLEIRATEPTAWLLWSEHKVGDPLTAEQLAKESDALAARAGERPSKLIAVTLYPPSPIAKAEADRRGVTLFGWRDVAAMAEAAGTRVAGNAWRVAPATGSDDMARRLLLEWAAFSRHELEEVVVEPLTHDRVEILAKAERAWETVAHLLSMALSSARDTHGIGAPKEVDDELHAAPPAGTWLADRGCNLYARCDASVSWATDEPALVFGAWVDGEHLDGLRKDTDLLQDLAARGFKLHDEPGKRGWFEIAKTLPLAETAVHDRLEDQERLVRAFCTTTIESLLAAAHDPGSGSAPGNRR